METLAVLIIGLALGVEIGAAIVFYVVTRDVREEELEDEGLEDEGGEE